MRVFEQRKILPEGVMGAYCLIAITQFTIFFHQTLYLVRVFTGAVKRKYINEKSYNTGSVPPLNECGLPTAKLRERKVVVCMCISSH